MKVVSFNLRVDTSYDKRDRFQFRKGLILDKLEAERPDWIGFQECGEAMADFLRRHLTDYMWLGCGRGPDFDGENNMLGFLRSRWEPIACDTFWLSPTPHVPGSRYEEQSPCPRVCTHALLRDMEKGGLYHFYNTHLDHESDSARVLGAQAILKRIDRDLQDWVCPVLLMGDMNAFPDSPPIEAFRQWGFRDDTDGIPNTFHDYLRRPDVPRIDYILTKDFPAAQTQPWKDTLHELPLSDHYPVCAQYSL